MARFTQSTPLTYFLGLKWRDAMFHYLKISEIAEKEANQSKAQQQRFQDLSKLKRNVVQENKPPPHPLFNPEEYAQQNVARDPFAPPEDFVHAPVGRKLPTPKI